MNSTTKLPLPMKPKKSSKIYKLVHSFTNTLDHLPPQKNINELSACITTEGYLTATFQWSHSINKQLLEYKQLVQYDQELITEFKERKHMVYDGVYNQECMDGYASKRHWCQYKLVDVSCLFEPQCPSRISTVSDQRSLSTQEDNILLHVLGYNSHIDDLIQQKQFKERSKFKKKT